MSGYTGGEGALHRSPSDISAAGTAACDNAAPHGPGGKLPADDEAAVDPCVAENLGSPNGKRSRVSVQEIVQIAEENRLAERVQTDELVRLMEAALTKAHSERDALQDQQGNDQDYLRQMRDALEVAGAELQAADAELARNRNLMHDYNAKETHMLNEAILIGLAHREQLSRVLRAVEAKYTGEILVLEQRNAFTEATLQVTAAALKDANAGRERAENKTNHVGKQLATCRKRYREEIDSNDEKRVTITQQTQEIQRLKHDFEVQKSQLADSKKAVAQHNLRYEEAMLEGPDVLRSAVQVADEIDATFDLSEKFGRVVSFFTGHDHTEALDQTTPRGFNITLRGPCQDALVRHREGVNAVC